MQNTIPNYLYAIFIITIIGCNSTNDPIIDEDLLGMVWRLDSLVAPDANLVFGRDFQYPVTIRFTQNMEVVGQGPCQQDYEGTYHIPAMGSLEISAHFVSDSTCKIGSLEMDVGPMFRSALTSVRSYMSTENHLRLYGGENSDEFYCTGSLIDEKLLNAVWRLDSLETPDAKILRSEDSLITIIYLTDTLRISHPSWDRFMTIQFSADTEIFGNMDCNDYYGIYAISKSGRIELDVLTWTEAGCRWLMTETLFIDVLENVGAHQVGEDRLTLYETNLDYVAYFSMQ